MAFLSIASLSWRSSSYVTRLGSHTYRTRPPFDSFLRCDSGVKKASSRRETHDDRQPHRRQQFRLHLSSTSGMPRASVHNPDRIGAPTSFFGLKLYGDMHIYFLSRAHFAWTPLHTFGVPCDHGLEHTGVRKYLYGRNMSMRTFHVSPTDPNAPLAKIRLCQEAREAGAL